MDVKNSKFLLHWKPSGQNAQKSPTEVGGSLEIKAMTEGKNLWTSLKIFAFLLLPLFWVSNEESLFC